MKAKKIKPARVRRNTTSECPFCHRMIRWDIKNDIEKHLKCYPNIKIDTTGKPKKNKPLFPVRNEADYRKYLRTRHWKRMKDKVYKYRKTVCCETCGSLLDRNVHHKTYKRLWNEKVSDLIILCRACHESEHFGLASDSLEQQHLDSIQEQ